MQFSPLTAYKRDLCHTNCHNVGGKLPNFTPGVAEAKAEKKRSATRAEAEAEPRNHNY